MNFGRKCLCLFVLLFFAVTVPSPLIAEPDLSAPAPKRKIKKRVIKSEEDDLLLDAIQDVDLKAAWDREARTSWTSPGLSVTTPSGFGAGWGVWYVGATFARRTRYSEIADGTMFVGTGVGNPYKNIGFDATFQIINLDPFLAGSALSLKLHRNLGNGYAIAGGLENALIFGSGTDGLSSGYGVVSRLFSLKQNEFEWFSSLMLSAGVGNGRFRSQQKLTARQDGIGPFGSVGVRVQAPVGLAASFNQREIDLGISIVPFRSFRFSINPSFLSVVNKDGGPTVFLISFAYGDSIFSETFPFFSVRTYR